MPVNQAYITLFYRLISKLLLDTARMHYLVDSDYLK